MAVRRPQLQTRSAKPAMTVAGPVFRRAHVNLVARAATVDAAARTFECIISTETPVRRTGELVGIGWGEFDEVLLTSGVDLNRIAGVAPLLDGHDASSTRSILGSIQAARTETVDGLGDVVVLSCRIEDGAVGDDVLAKIGSGALGSVSAGYRVSQYEMEAREGSVPVARAIAWTLAEASLVPVGADPNARIRSAETVPPVPAPTDKPTPEPKAEDAGAVDVTEAFTAIETAAKSLVDALAGLKKVLAGDEAPKPAETPKSEAKPPVPAPAPEDGSRAAPAIDTRAIFDALQVAGRGDPRVRTIRAMASAVNLGPLGEDMIRMGLTVEQASEDIRTALITRSENGATISGRSAPGPEIEPVPVIDTNAIYGRLAAASSHR